MSIKTKVKIIDAAPGTGKSSWAFQYIKDNPDKKWIYVSPYLDEVGDGNRKGRVKEECPDQDFKSPTKNSRRNKTEHLQELLESNENIACTHALFNRMTSEHCVWIKHHKYHIIIDEVLEGISLLSVTSDVKQDVISLLSEDFLLQHEDGRLEWNPAKPVLRIFKEIIEYAERGELYLYQDDVLIKRGNSKAIASSQECFVMTYLFESSLMSKWLQIHSIDYEMYFPELHRSESEVKHSMQHLVKVFDVPKNIQKIEEAQSHPHFTFSSTSYKKRLTEKDFSTMKRTLESFVRRVRNDSHLDKKGEVLWTTFKDYQEILEGHGYTFRSGASADDAVTPFASKNMRASNEYADKNVVLYTVNIFAHPTLTSYVEHMGFDFDEDEYALSECIQFIYRSAIRNGNPIIVLFFSSRMRELFINWLHR